MKEVNILIDLKHVSGAFSLVECAMTRLLFQPNINRIYDTEQNGNFM